MQLMNTTITRINRITTGLTLMAATAALTAVALAEPTLAQASPVDGQLTQTPAARSVPGDAPLPSYPGLPAGKGDTSGRASVAVSTTPVPCASNGADKPMTRSQALTRAQSWLNVGIPYSQDRCYHNAYGDYRTDCSGFVSMAWGVGGLGSDQWTGNFGDISHSIARADLRPGDALLRYTGDPDENHVALFVRWADAAHTQPVVMEQTGSRDTIQDTWSQSTASLYTPVRYDHIVDGSGGVVSADVTGDGRSDLVARKSDGTLWLYTNGGSNTAPYSTGSLIGTGWLEFGWFLAGDVTGDGRADIVAERPDGTIYLYANGGSNTSPYSTGSQIGSGWQQFRTVTLADVTGDGRADLVATRSDGTLLLYPNGGSNTSPYSSGSQIGSGWQPFSWVLGGDVTGDGRADIVAAKPDGTLWLYPNGGSNTSPYSTGSQIGNGWQQFDRIMLGDVTGDSRTDVVATSPDGTLLLYTNGGSNTGPYSTGSRIGSGWQIFA
jgi:hypothetical protein